MFLRHAGPVDDGFQLRPRHGLQHQDFGRFERQPDPLRRGRPLVEQRRAELGVHGRFLDQHFHAAGNRADSPAATRRTPAHDRHPHRRLFLGLIGPELRPRCFRRFIHGRPPALQQ